MAAASCGIFIKPPTGAFSAERMVYDMSGMPASFASQPTTAR
jgi:hypothetical protein